MRHPLFQENEEALIGPYPHTGAISGMECRVERLLKPIYGEHRYEVRILETGALTRVLEVTLRKDWAKQRSDWGALKTIWQPKREAR